MNDNLVSVKNVSVEFDYQENFLSKKQKIQAVKNVSLNIKKKSFLMICVSLIIFTLYYLADKYFF